MGKNMEALGLLLFNHKHGYTLVFFRLAVKLGVWRNPRSMSMGLCYTARSLLIVGH